MVSDEVYELCLPVLQDESLEDEDKTEKLEELLRKETSLSGKPLEDSVLDSLWRYRGNSGPTSSPPPVRHTIIRRSSPAPWQVARAPTPSNSSPRTINPPPGFGVVPPGFSRAKSSTASPFTSPRPSPRLALATPYIPHSPNLNAYEFSDSSPTPEIYGDYGSDTVDWLVNDEVGSNASSSVPGDASLNGAAAEWVQPYTMDMDPYDMLRSILRDDRPNEEIERALEANGYDFTATIQALMDSQGIALQQQATLSEPDKTYLVGKSISPSFRPATPAGQAKTSVLCKYWLATGQCARAGCRFSHDPSKTVCKYWLSGNCLAGDTCLFSHDPTNLMAKLMLEGSSTPPTHSIQPNFQVQDYETFPSLQPATSQQYMNHLQNSLEPTTLEQMFGAGRLVSPPPGLSPFPTFTPRSASNYPNSRPSSSRQHSRAPTPSAPAADDTEAFPTLASAAAAKGAKRHHGKRGGHGHNKENGNPSTLADVVRMTPSPTPAQVRKSLRPTKSFNGSRENSAAAQSIPAPDHIPWLETGEVANKAYLKARSEAFKHGGLRNKFLQSAAQAWNRNDSRAAKALSLRGQSENNLMRAAHREAAEHLYNERNKDNSPSAKELYVDLHGLHPEESVTYLSKILLAHQSSSRPVYAITGTGHHSKNGKDKVGKAVRGFLNEWRYVFREFSVPGDRGNVGGILGIDPSSWDRGLEGRDSGVGSEGGEETAEGGGKVSSKVRVVKAEDVLTGPRR